MRKFLLHNLLVLVGLLYFTNANAYDFEVDGIKYNILPTEQKKVEVTHSKYNNNTWQYSTFYTGNIVIPSSVEFNNQTYIVTKIGQQAFFHCKDLSNVTLPETLDSIEGQAFYACKGLTSIKIPNKVSYIGNEAFAYSSLSQINISNEKPIYAGIDVLFETPWWESMPDGIVYLGNNVYKYKGEMPENHTINIKKGTLSIFGGAFDECDRLVAINIPNSVGFIGEGCFGGCKNLQGITLPNTLQGIGKSCFWGCETLSTIDIPNKITILSPTTFYGCKQLKAIKLSSSLKEIGEQCFYNCSSLSSISIPGSVERISDEVFCNCGLSSVRFEDSNVPISLGLGSKRYNKGLFNNSAIKYLYIGRDIDAYYGLGLGEYHMAKVYEIGSCVTQFNPQNLSREIEKLIIHDSPNALSITSPINAYYVDTLYLGRNTPLLIFSEGRVVSATISGNCTNITDEMFKRCKSLKNVKLSNNITSIGNSAFAECTALDSIVLPSKLDNLGSAVFQGAGVKEIIIPNGIIAIKARTFTNCKSLVYAKLGENTQTIDFEAFYGTAITSIIIPKNVTTIGESAFAYCDKLDKVFMKTSTAEVGIGAFACGAAHRITYAPNMNYSSLTGIGSTIVSNLAVNIFEDGDYIYLPLSGAKKTCAIVDWQNHAKNKNVVIPFSVKYGKQTLTPTEIGKNTCYDCGITSLKLSENIISISDNAFYGNSKIKKLNFPDAVTSIGENAFNGCTDLTTITLGCNVAKIDAAAFANCANVTDIISYNPEAPVCVKGVFDSVDKFSCNVYVPKNSVDIYASATEWEDFFNLIEMPYEGGTQTITLNVSKYLWSTLILPFDAEIPAGLKVYDVYDTDETGCVPTEVDKIKANVPYLVKGIMGKYKFSGISKAIEETYSNGLLTGTHASNYEAPIGSYVLQYHIGSGFAFYKVNRDGIMLPANRCYLTKDASAAKFLVPFVTEETTGINDITNDVANTASTIYTLDGKVVNASKQNQNGIFVIDGKKVIIK